MKRLFIPALALLLSLPAQADTLWGYNQGSSQVLGFASSSGSVTDVRWLGDPAANNFGYFSSLNLDVSGTLWAYAQGSSQLLGFDVGSGSLTQARWLGDATANQFSQLSQLAIAADGVLWGYNRDRKSVV